MRLSEQARKRLAEIPGETGWWHSSGEKAFVELAEELASVYLSEDKALELLETAYGAVSGEFGD